MSEQPQTTDGSYATYENVPITLKSRENWLVTAGKRPVRPAKWNSSELLSFEKAVDIIRNGSQSGNGLGYVFQDGGPLVGVDFDHVREADTGKVDPEVEQVVRELESWTEISSSGTGLHTLLTGERNPEYKHEGDIGDGSVEVYEADRYFVLTGDRYLPDQLPAVPKPTGKVFERFESRYLKERSNHASAETNSSSGSDKTLPEIAVESDETLHQRVTSEQILATASKYSPTFRALVHGESIDGITDDSELDSKLVSRLVFWCRGNRELVDACFRQSDRFNCRLGGKAKWDTVRTSSGATYGEHLIRKALGWNSEVYQGTYVQRD
jgi:putative DNA primase/helicase